MEIKNKDINTICTIVVPTYNRPYYLRRMLTFYGKHSDFRKYKMVIADSSYDENKELNKKIVKQFSDLNMLYLNDYPVDICANRKISSSLDYVKSKYCIIGADDDFIIPQGIEESMAFLEKNPDFTVVHGESIAFWSRSVRGNKQQFYWEPSKVLFSVEFSDPLERLVYHLSNYYPTFYSVYRCDFLKMSFKESEKFTNDPLFEELLLSMLALLYGKMKYLDVFYLARDKGNIACAQNPTVMQDFIKIGTYNEKYFKFRDCLAIHLIKKTQLDIAEIKKSIDDAMSIYLSFATEKQPLKNIIIRKIKDILGRLGLPIWLYNETKFLYRNLFLSKQKQMDDLEAFIDAPIFKHYDEIKNVHNYLSSYSKILNSKG